MTLLSYPCRWIAAAMRDGGATPWILTAAFLGVVGGARADAPAAASPETLQWFQTTEQALMDALAPGDKAPWERVMDASCVVTTEEGQVLTREQFLDELGPLPQGLSGGITVKDLTVQELPNFAVVRYLADERESVFGQALSVHYRVTNGYRRDGSTWKMVLSHLSVVTRDPPAQAVSRAGWPGLVGRYRLLPDGWTLTVELRDGELYAGRDPKKLKPLVPLAPDAFVLSGSLGEWVFVMENGRAVRLVNLRKLAVLVWTRVESAS
jgi:ketosteroid isomerase-like protein